MASILVVDDDLSLRKMVRLALVRAGHRVEVAPDGPAGLGAFGDGAAWDLTLVDERMPGLTGREVVREARRRDPGARLVMITAHDTTELASEVIRDGASDLLRKPFSTDMLRAAVSASLARPRAPSGAAPHLRPGGRAPSVTHWLSGYRYWPVALAPSEAERMPQGLRVCRAFQVEGPTGLSIVSVVGVTPHVRESVLVTLGFDPGDESPVWDTVCADGMADYLWEREQLPPEVLPIYGLSAREREVVRASAPYLQAETV